MSKFNEITLEGYKEKFFRYDLNLNVYRDIYDTTKFIVILETNVEPTDIITSYRIVNGNVILKNRDRYIKHECEGNDKREIIENNLKFNSLNELPIGLRIEIVNNFYSDLFWEVAYFYSCEENYEDIFFLFDKIIGEENREACYVDLYNNYIYNLELARFTGNEIKQIEDLFFNLNKMI